MATPRKSTAIPAAVYGWQVYARTPQHYQYRVDVQAADETSAVAAAVAAGTPAEQIEHARRA